MLVEILKRALVGALSIPLLVGGCGGESSGGAGGASAGSATGATGGAGTGASGGGANCSDCSDGFACTIDACDEGTCNHTIGPSEGSTACPPGEYCTLESGCVAAPACATTADCDRAWSGDACKTELACEAATSACVFKVLDKDGDGHPPPVCGGGDCDDTEARRYLGKAEVCDELDNDCDGAVDDGCVCPECAEWLLDRLVPNPGALCAAQVECMTTQENPQVSGFLQCMNGCGGACAAFFQGPCKPVEDGCLSCLEMACAAELAACKQDKLPDRE